MSILNFRDYVPPLSVVRNWLDRRYGATPGGTPYWQIQRLGLTATWKLVVYRQNRPGFDEVLRVTAASEREALQDIYVRARQDADELGALRTDSQEFNATLATLGVQKSFDAKFYDLLVLARRRHSRKGQLLPVETIERRLAWQRLTCPVTLLKYWLRSHCGPNLEAPPFNGDELFNLELIDKFGILRAVKFCAFVKKAIDTDYDPEGKFLALKHVDKDIYEALYWPLPKTVPGQITVPVRRKTPIAVHASELAIDRYFYPLASAVSELYWLQRWGVSRQTVHSALGHHFDDVDGGYDLQNDAHWRWAAELQIMGTDFKELRTDHNAGFAEEFVRIALVKLMRDKVFDQDNKPLTDFLYQDELDGHRMAMYRARRFLTNALHNEDRTVEFPPRLLVRIMAGG